MNRDVERLLEEKYGGKGTEQFMKDAERLAGGEPLAYVIGHQPFLGLSIHLDSRPLIPRAETEWWTEQLLGELAEEKSGVGLGLAARSAPDFSSASKPTFLDLCAGSGAVGCAALKYLPNAEVYFGELDPTHAATIEKNIRENGLDALRAHVQTGDLFEPFGNLKFDVIASNPPYVPSDRILPDSVAKYEPPQALFAGKDGLDIIRRIAAELPSRLNPGGVAWLEFDRAHAEEVRRLFEENGFIAEIRTDQYRKPRFAVVSFPA